MRVLLAVVLLMLAGTLAYAADSVTDEGISLGIDQPVDPPRDVLFCQPPTSGYYTFNASTGYDSEIADDIPEEFGSGSWMVTEIVVYVGEWGDTWQDPLGVNVHLYSGACPPEMAPYQTLFFPWGDPQYMDFFYVNDQPGSYDLEVTLYVDPPIQIVGPMSMGFQVDNGWGDSAPYSGIDYTNDNDIYGCGEAYIAHEYWGHPRWTLASISHGAPVDVAYCLDAFPVTATGNSTWSTCKSLY